MKVNQPWWLQDGKTLVGYVHDHHPDKKHIVTRAVYMDKGVKKITDCHIYHQYPWGEKSRYEYGEKLIANQDLEVKSKLLEGVKE